MQSVQPVQKSIKDCSSPNVESDYSSLLFFGRKAFAECLVSLVQDIVHLLISIFIRLRLICQFYPLSHAESIKTVKARCKLLFLLSKQFLFRKHDFTFYLQRYQAGIKTQIHSMELIAHIFLFTKSKIRIQFISQRRAKKFKTSKMVAKHNISCTLVGGGISTHFELNDLKPYIPRNL